MMLCKILDIRNHFIVSVPWAVFSLSVTYFDADHVSEEILFVQGIGGVIQAESKIYCILEADLLLSVHQSSFNNKRAAQLQLCISNSLRTGLSSPLPPPLSPCN